VVLVWTETRSRDEEQRRGAETRSRDEEQRRGKVLSFSRLLLTAESAEEGEAQVARFGQQDKKTRSIV